MAKKEKEVVENQVNGLLDNQEVETVETAQPTQEVTLNEVPVQAETPGHTTRAFRG